MAITITLKDANKDGKGIDFNAYLKAYDKNFAPSDYGGFVNENYDNGGTPGDMNDDVWRGDDYVVWDGRKNGQSVIFEGGEDGWKYVFDGHTMTGDLTGVCDGLGGCFECNRDAQCEDTSKPYCTNRLCQAASCEDGA